MEATAVQLAVRKNRTVWAQRKKGDHKMVTTPEWGLPENGVGLCVPCQLHRVPTQDHTNSSDVLGGDRGLSYYITFSKSVSPQVLPEEEAGGHRDV